MNMDTEALRKEFAAWATDQGYPMQHLHGEEDAGYVDLRTEGAWEAWQAARAALREQPADPCSCEWRHIAEALLTAQKAQQRTDEIAQKYGLAATPTAPPTGWKWVPVESTTEMIEAALPESNRQRKILRLAWRAMLAASPEPGEQKENG